MTKEVLISISGLQMMGDDQDHVEIITVGEYFFRNGNHYVLYEEMVEELSGSTKNMIKISSDRLEIVKKGVSNTKMRFETNEKKHSSYLTPYGELIIGIHTKQIIIEEHSDQMKIDIDYALDINYEHVSDCHINMKIQSKEMADLKLC